MERPAIEAPMAGGRAHWQRIYRDRSPEEVSWYEPTPDVSMSLIEAAGVARTAAVLDVGAGASRLAASLLEAGFVDVTAADLSAEALQRARAELGSDAERVTWVEADVRTHDFRRRYDLWHDRAMFHFMVEPVDRQAYLTALLRALRPGGSLIIASFGPAGPETCSGLPVARYDEAGLAGVLGDAFEPISSRLETHQTPSGGTQQFLYAHLRRRGQPAGGVPEDLL